jgi:hypothetical protein
LRRARVLIVPNAPSSRCAGVNFDFPKVNPSAASTESRRTVVPISSTETLVEDRLVKELFALALAQLAFMLAQWLFREVVMPRLAAG